MATAAGGGGRKKRQWKKAREEAGPDHGRQTGTGASGRHTADIGSAPSSGIVEIDGSVLEGGGQILRNATSLSCLLSKPIHITSIRAGRSNPGLRPQHLTGIQLLSNLCRGRLAGDKPGSSEILFHPQTDTIGHGRFIADAKTAGSVCLMIQAALPCAIFASGPTELVLRGGTNAEMAPPIDYFQKVFLPIAERFGVTCNCTISKRGFYPKGQGEVIVSTTPVDMLHSINMTEKGDLVDLTIETFTAGAVPTKVGHMISDSAKRRLQRDLSSIEIVVNTLRFTEREAFGNGSGILIIGRTSSGCVFGGSAVGSRAESPENTGVAAAEQLLAGINAGGCVDEHLQDQLIVLMALAKGHSAVATGPLTLHTQTAIHIAELMTEARFTIRKVSDTINIIECEGIGKKIT